MKSVPQHLTPIPRLAWLALVEDHGWTPEKIASAWNESIEVVMEALSEASSQPLHRTRQVLPLPGTKGKAIERRDLIRLLSRQGASVEELAQRFCYYSTEVMAKIVKQPLETNKGIAWGTRGHCHCGCGVKVAPRQWWATPGCKKRMQRKSGTTSK
jgi:hypothetical protein